MHSLHLLAGMKNRCATRAYPINPSRLYGRLVSKATVFCISLWRTTKGSLSFRFYIIHEPMPLCDAARLHSRTSSSLSHKYATLTHILSYYTLPRWSGCQSSFLFPLWHSIKVRIQRFRSSVGIRFCIIPVRIQTSLTRSSDGGA